MVSKGIGENDIVGGAAANATPSTTRRVCALPPLAEARRMRWI
jgi:hypothetical protein